MSFLKARCFKLGTHIFTKIDVDRVKKGVEKAKCKNCSPHARAYSGKNLPNCPPDPNCKNCKVTRARLTILKEHMEKEGLL